MSSFGPIAFRRAGAPWEEDGGMGFSESTARRVDEEIRDLVMRGYETARRLIGRHREAVEALAEELLLVESLDAAAVRTLLEGRADRLVVAARSMSDESR
jgi:ATP-dependent Zn protease